MSYLKMLKADEVDRIEQKIKKLQSERDYFRGERDFLALEPADIKGSIHYMAGYSHRLSVQAIIDHNTEMPF